MSVDITLQRIDDELKIIMDEIGIEKSRQLVLVEKLPLKKKLNMIHSILSDEMKLKKVGEYINEIRNGGSRVFIVGINSILPFGVNIFVKDGVRVFEERIKNVEGIELEDILELVTVVLSETKNYNIFSDEFYNHLLFRKINLSINFLEAIEYLSMNFIDDFSRVLLMGHRKVCCYKNINFYRLIEELVKMRRPPTKFIEYILDSKNRIFRFILSSMKFTSKFRKTESIRRIEVKLVEKLINDKNIDNKDNVVQLIENSILKHLQKEEIQFFLNSLENYVLKNNFSLGLIENLSQNVDMINKGVKISDNQKENKIETKATQPVEKEKKKPVLLKTLIKKPMLKKPATVEPQSDVKKLVLNKPVLNKPGLNKPGLNKPVLNKPGLKKPILNKKMPPKAGGLKLPPKNKIKLIPDKEFINVRWTKMQKNDSIFKDAKFDEMDKIFSLKDFEPFVKEKKVVAKVAPPKIENKPKGIFDTKKSNAIEIALGRIRIENEKLLEHITSLDAENLNENLIKQIILNIPTTEEKQKLKTASLGNLTRGEDFYKRTLEVENFISYLDFIYFVKNIYNLSSIHNNLQIFLDFFTNVRASQEFLKYIQYTLYLGNILNGKSFLGNAEAYNLLSLNVFKEVIGKDKKSVFDIAIEKVNKNKIIEDFKNIKEIITMDYRSIISEYEEIKRLYLKVKDTGVKNIEDKITEYKEQIEGLIRLSKQTNDEYQKFGIFCAVEVNEKLFEEFYKFIESLKS
ncbi:Formin like protein [Spraguea lophii 42_110]|uniref:Formin like protein n=1 Tax=Spraguea lophii (strain 42_110) TaxID=1358809 RepID=S7XTS3_SPRLO|nr:Formin like protein [Spraguea lophii 42_110]